MASNEETALDRAIATAGSITALAESIEVSQGRVSTWRYRGRVPANQCVRIQAAVNGAVRACELRPDVFPPMSDNNAAA